MEYRNKRLPASVLSDIVTVRLGPQRARDELSERSIDNDGNATFVFWVGGFTGVHGRHDLTGYETKPGPSIYRKVPVFSMLVCPIS